MREEAHVFVWVCAALPGPDKCVFHGRCLFSARLQPMAPSPRRHRSTKHPVEDDQLLTIDTCLRKSRESLQAAWKAERRRGCAQDVVGHDDPRSTPKRVVGPATRFRPVVVGLPVLPMPVRVHNTLPRCAQEYVLHGAFSCARMRRVRRTAGPWFSSSPNHTTRGHRMPASAYAGAYSRGPGVPTLLRKIPRRIGATQLRPNSSYAMLRPSHHPEEVWRNCPFFSALSRHAPTLVCFMCLLVIRRTRPPSTS